MDDPADRREQSTRMVEPSMNRRLVHRWSRPRPSSAGRPDPSLSCLFLKVATHPSWVPSSSRAARPPGMRPLAATVRRRPAGGCGPAPTSGIQPSGMHPQPGPGCARVRRRRPAPSLRVPRSRAGSYWWPVREPRRTDGRCPAPTAPKRRADAGGTPFTRCRVVRGGEVMRCAGRRRRPCGAADDLAPPAPVARDTRRVGPRRRAVPAR